jgi:hypothetical protein
MTTYLLILYLSMRPGQSSSTGGPAVVDGFKTLEKCEAANQVAKEQLKQYNWGECLKVEK